MNATYVTCTAELYEYYAKKHNYTGKAKKFLLRSRVSMFKVLMPIYLNEKFGVERTYTIR